MPNWCANTLTLTHEDPAMILRAKEAFASGKFLEEFIPIPPAEKDNWYSWCVSNWGTKWDVGDGDGINETTENSLIVYFDSAWAPPVEAYRTLESEFGFTVEAYYYEPGLDFAGIYRDGEDDYYEELGTAENVRENLPAELDEMFNISEEKAQWEEEMDDDEE